MLRDHFSVYGWVLLWKKSNYNVHLSNFVSKYLITLQSQTPRKMHFSEMNFHKKGLVINVCLVIFEMHIFPVYFQLKIHTHLVLWCVFWAAGWCIWYLLIIIYSAFVVMKEHASQHNSVAHCNSFWTTVELCGSDEQDASCFRQCSTFSQIHESELNS